MKKFKDLTGAHHFVFKSDVDAVLNGQKTLLNIYAKRGPNMAILNSGDYPEKNNIDENEEIIEIR